MKAEREISMFGEAQCKKKNGNKKRGNETVEIKASRNDTGHGSVHK